MAAATKIFSISSYSNDGSLVIYSEDGIRYEYTQTTAFDVKKLLQLLNRRDYKHGWKYLKALNLFTIQRPGEKEKRVTKNVFEGLFDHLMESKELFPPTPDDEVYKRRLPMLRAMKEFDDELDSNSRRGEEASFISMERRDEDDIVEEFYEKYPDVEWDAFLLWMDGHRPDRSPQYFDENDADLFAAYDDWNPE